MNLKNKKYYKNNLKNLLILQFYSDENILKIIGTITDVETRYSSRGPNNYVIHYAFFYYEKIQNASFYKKGIYYNFYSWLTGNRYKSGNWVSILYNANNNFYCINTKIPIEIVKSIFLIIFLPLVPIIFIEFYKIARNVLW